MKWVAIWIIVFGPYTNESRVYPYSSQVECERYMEGALNNFRRQGGEVKSARCEPMP